VSDDRSHLRDEITELAARIERDQQLERRDGAPGALVRIGVAAVLVASGIVACSSSQSRADGAVAVDAGGEDVRGAPDSGALDAERLSDSSSPPADATVVDDAAACTPEHSYCRDSDECCALMECIAHRCALPI
jgi:hypothetical protein